MQPAAQPQSSDPVLFARRMRENIARAVVGKDDAVDTCLAALVAGGHILLEDVPGVGKTTLGRAVAASLGVSFARVQFTSDLLPSDIVGSAIPDRRAGATPGQLVFQQGPIFANVVLADELNRTTPRTQSSLLEAMADGKVTVDGVTHPLPSPFLVIATQNPLEHHGTYPLPESQLDRFAVRLTLGYPAQAEERRLLLGRGLEEPVDALTQVASADDVVRLQEAAAKVRVNPSVADYALAVVAATRESDQLAAGASTRAALGLMALARARALLQGRDFVSPDDVKRLARPALAHRLVPLSGVDPSRAETAAILDEILGRVPVPE